MTAADYFYEVARGHGLSHDPLSSIVAPRPIGWISTLSAKGNRNLAPYSYFNMVSSKPPILCFSTQGWKDTARNIAETGEFVVNTVGRALVDRMNSTSVAFPHDVDETRMAGLVMEECRLVAPPRVAGSPAALECRVIGIDPLRDLDGRPLEWLLVLGQVLAVHIDQSCLREGRFDPVLARTVARCGYRGDYTQVTETFELFRP